MSHKHVIGVGVLAGVVLALYGVWSKKVEAEYAGLVLTGASIVISIATWLA